MEKYEVLIKPSAVKEIESLPRKDRQRIFLRIESLADSPRPAGCRKLSSRDYFRIRQGQYRIVYKIEDDQLVVLVVKVGHRKSVYRSL